MKKQCNFLLMQLFYLLHNRRILITLGILFFFNIYLVFKKSININMQFITIQSLIVYLLLIHSLYLTLFNRDNLLGRFEHYIAHGYKLTDLIFLRSFIISFLGIIITISIFLLNILFFSNFRNLIIKLPNFTFALLCFFSFLLTTFLVINISGYLQTKFNIDIILRYFIIFVPVIIYKIIFRYYSNGIPLLTVYVIFISVINLISILLMRRTNNEIITHL